MFNLTVKQLVDTYNKLLEQRKDVEQALKQLGHDTSRYPEHGAGSWLEGAKKDARYSAKLLVNEWLELDADIRQLGNAHVEDKTVNGIVENMYREVNGIE